MDWVRGSLGPSSVTQVPGIGIKKFQRWVTGDTEHLEESEQTWSVGCGGRCRVAAGVESWETGLKCAARKVKEPRISKHLSKVNDLLRIKKELILNDQKSSNHYNQP